MTVKLDVTPPQMEAIKRMADDVASMIGCGEYGSDETWRKNVKLVDRMLEKNGHQRYFKGED